uniref:Uncharacterized protein n=1 Tax=Avena sativa TaxID=4498 RepID=A0ACD5ZN27_AVESA
MEPICACTSLVNPPLPPIATNSPHAGALHRSNLIHRFCAAAGQRAPPPPPPRHRPSNLIQPYPMLLPVSRLTDKFAPLAGLRSLLVPDTAAGVLTRTIPALPPCAACGEESEEDEDDEGCWVSYGRRDLRGRRRLPPPIPSLAARSALRRARTDDRRLVISRERVMRPDYYVRARRVRGGRLVMRLVEREDDDPLRPSTAREGDDIAQVVVAEAEVDVAAEPAPLPAAGCLEDAVKYQYAIGSSPLHQTPLLRMVH